MATIFPTSVPTKRLSESISASASSFKLNNIEGWDGNDLTSADFGTKAYGVFRNSANTLMELFEFDPSTIANASITILLRGLKFTGDLTTEVSANKLTWIKGDTVVELGSDVPQLLKHYIDDIADQSIAGIKTFSSFPVKSGTSTPTASGEFATKAYVDSTATVGLTYDQEVISGVAGETISTGEFIYFKTSDQRWWKTDADAVATSLGVKLGVAQGAGTAGNAFNVLISGVEKNQSGLTAGSKYYLSGTAGAISTTPGTYHRYVGTAKTTTYLHFEASSPEAITLSGNQVYATDSVGTDAYAITLPMSPVAYKDGMRFLFKAGTVNTGNATLNVNSLGAKNILKNYNQSLSDGEIAAGQIIEVVYDGTQDAFQMMTPVAALPTPTGTVAQFGGYSAPTGWLLCDGTAVSRSTYSTLFSLLNPSLGTFTVTIASPGVFTLNSHGLVAGDTVYFTTTGALPTGLSANTIYYVISAGLTANDFEVSTSYGGAAVNTSGSQSGTHTLRRSAFGLGDGSTTFNVPNFKGKVPVGVDSSDSNFKATGYTGGASTHTLTSAEMPTHTHGYPNGPTGTGGLAVSYVQFATTGPAYTGTTTAYWDNAGSGGAHNNLQPYRNINFIIKT